MLENDERASLFCHHCQWRKKFYMIVTWSSVSPEVPKKLSCWKCFLFIETLAYCCKGNGILSSKEYRVWGIRDMVLAQDTLYKVRGTGYRVQAKG